MCACIYKYNQRPVADRSIGFNSTKRITLDAVSSVNMLVLVRHGLGHRPETNGSEVRLGRQPPRATIARRRTGENFNDAYEQRTRSTQGWSASLSITKPIPPRSARGCGDPAGQAGRLVCREYACVCTGYGSADRGREAEEAPRTQPTSGHGHGPSRGEAVNEADAGSPRFLGGRAGGRMVPSVDWR